MFAIRLLWFIAATALGVTTASLTGAGKDGPVEIKIVNIERLNTSADEDDPAPGSDGLSLYFTSNAAGNVDLMSSVRKNRMQPFATATRIDELSGKSDDCGPCPMPRSLDGDEYFYFASQRDAKNFDIFFTRRLKPNEPFMRIAVAAVHNVCTDEDELHPCVMADELSMFFSRRTKDGWRVGYARGTAKRTFEKVELLDFPPGFRHPSVTKDGLTMYLHGPVEKRGEKLGLFVSKRANKNAKWPMPKPLEALNSKDSVKGDCSPRIAPDGTHFYFVSDRPGGKGGLDLYVVAASELRKVVH